MYKLIVSLTFCLSVASSPDACHGESCTAGASMLQKASVLAKVDDQEVDLSEEPTLGGVFDGIDKNGDGKISKTEFNTAAQNVIGDDDGGSGSSTPAPTKGSKGGKAKTPKPTKAPKGKKTKGDGGGATGAEGKTPTTVPDRWVNAHNYWRCIHDAPPIAWDTDFAAGAQAWADRGQFSHSSCYKIPPPQGPAGENLAGGSHMCPEKAANMWRDESPERGPKCGGHCTAMLWKAAKKLGCGISPDKSSVYVCRYGGGDPLPNFGSQYAANVGFPDDSKESECDKKWPRAECTDGGFGGGGGGGSGGGGSGGGGGGYARRSDSRYR